MTLEAALATALADYVERGLLHPDHVREIVEDLACRVVIETEVLVAALPAHLQWKVEP